MILTIVVYIFLLLFSLVCAYLYKHSKSKNHVMWLWFAIVVYSIIVGCRYDVGIDFNAYMTWFVHNLSDRQTEMETEWLKTTLKTMGFGFTSFFICMAGVQISFFLFSFRQRPQIIVWGTFFFFATLQFFLSMNVLRQVAVWCIFLYSIQYIQQKKFWSYLLCILCGMLFHNSSVVLLPFYFIPRNLNISRSILLGIYLIVFAIGTVIQDRVAGMMGFAALLIGYHQYGDNIEQVMEKINFAKENSLGIVKFVWLVLNCATIYYYPTLKCRFKDQGFGIIYILFFLGIVTDCIVGGTVLDRAAMYFLPFRIIIYAYMFHYLSSTKQTTYKVLFVSGGAVAMLFFYVYSGIFGNASGCTPFKFI